MGADEGEKPLSAELESGGEFGRRGGGSGEVEGEVLQGGGCGVEGERGGDGVIDRRDEGGEVGGRAKLVEEEEKGGEEGEHGGRSHVNEDGGGEGREHRRDNREHLWPHTLVPISQQRLRRDRGEGEE